MGRILTMLAVALTVFLSAGLVVPPFLDWSHLRAPMEATARDLAGAPVSIGGSIRVQLLPSPTVSLGDVQTRLPAARTGLPGPISVRADRVDVDMDWTFWIDAAARVTGLTLDGVVVEGPAVGSAVQWGRLLDGLSTGPGLGAAVAVSDAQLRTETGAVLAELDKAHWGKGEAGRTWSLDGRVAGVPVSFSGSATDGLGTDDKPGAQGVVGRLRWRLVADEAGFSLRYTGMGQPNSARPLVGSLTLKADSLADLARLMDRGGDRAGDEARDPFTAPIARLPVSLEATTAPVSNARGEAGLAVKIGHFDLGRFQFAGAATFSVVNNRPNVSLDLSTPTLVVEETLGSLEGTLGPLANALSLKEPLEPERIAAIVTPRPLAAPWSECDADLSLSVASLLWQKSVFKGASLAARVEAGQLSLAEARGALPGGAHVAVTAPAAGDRRSGALWHGELRIEAAYPRPFFDWLGLPIENVAPGRLGALEGSARLAVSAPATGEGPPNQLTLQGARLVLGDMVLEGDGAVSLGGPQIQGEASLAARGLDLSMVAAILDPTGASGSGSETGETGEGGTGQAVAGRPVSMAFVIEGQALKAAGRDLTRLTLEGVLDRRNGDVGLTFSKIDMADPKGTGVAGTARLFAPAPRPRDQEPPVPWATMDLHLSAATLGGLLRSLHIDPARETAVLPGMAGALGAPVGVHLGGRLQDRRLVGGIDGLLGEMRVAGKANLRLADGAMLDWPMGGDLTLDLTADDGRAIATLLGLPMPVRASGPGETDTVREPADLSGRLSAQILLGEGTGTAELALELAGLDATATVDLDPAATPARLNGRLSVTTPPLEGLDALGPLSMTGLVSGSLASLRFGDLAGRVGDTLIGGDLTVTRPAEAPGSAHASRMPVVLTGDVVLDTLRLENPSRYLGVDLGAALQGEANWPVAPLDLSWLERTPTGAVTLSVGILTIGGYRLQDVTLPLSLSEGRLVAEGIRAGVGEGALDGAVTINRDGQGAAHVAVSVEARDLPVAAGFPPGPQDSETRLRLEGRVSGSARIEASGFSLFDLASELSGSVEIAEAALTVTPMDMAALAEAWPSLETLSGFEAAVARMRAGDGTPVEDLTGRFEIVDGTADTDGLTGEWAGRPLSVTGAVNVPARLVDLDAAFTISADAAPVNLRLSGPPGAISHHLDASELRYDAAMRIKTMKADRITEDDLPANVLELLRILEEEPDPADPGP